MGRASALNLEDRRTDLDFLEKFRGQIDRYLFLGYIPPSDPRALEGDTSPLDDICEALKTKEYQNLRREINEMTPRVKRLMAECNTTPTVIQYPAPAVGGSVLKVEVLDLIHHNTMERQIPKSVVIDAIDQTIGVLKAKPSKPASRKPIGERYVFISHSSKDTTIISTVKQAFEDLHLTPQFVEDKPTGIPPSKEIARAVRDAEALFVFLTYNSIAVDTRDWIVFEIGVAVGHDRPVFCWNQRSLSKGQLPRLLDQVTTYREFDISSEGVIKLVKEIRAAAKEL